MHFNYVYFVSEDGNKVKKNPRGYYSICVKDLDKLDNVITVSYPLDYRNFFVRLFFAFHTSKKINKHFHLPLQDKWYPYYFKNTFSIDRPICFVVESTYLPLSYISYCRERFPGCVFIKLHRDLMKVTYASNPDYNEENLEKYFDYRFSYDKNEALKYKCIQFDEFESKIYLPDASVEYDVFFAGKAKNRMSLLIEAYDHLTSLGLKCFFFITKCPEEEKKKRAGIVYSKKPMSYFHMLECTKKAKCLLDINQINAVGFTSRFLEGVMYDKKIITNNPNAIDSNYYNPKFIRYFERIDEIDIDFFEDNATVNYHYNDDFSPIHLIEQIDCFLETELNKHD